MSSSNNNSRQSFFEALKIRDPVYQPGTTPICSDAAFCLLALALEKITGKSFADTMQESILSPLNISATSVGTPASDTNAVIPADASTSGWQILTTDSALLAATGFSQPSQTYPSSANPSSAQAYSPCQPPTAGSNHTHTRPTPAMASACPSTSTRPPSQAQTSDP